MTTTKSSTSSALVAANLRPDLALRERVTFPTSRGSSSEGFLSGDQKHLVVRDEKSAPSIGKGSAKLDVKQNVITGQRYGDTFEGGRVNRRSGAGMYGSNSITGGNGSKAASGDLDSKRNETRAAAQSAYENGLITGEQRDRMSDGTVSTKDVNESRTISAEQAGNADADPGAQESAQRLQAAVGAQHEAQSAFDSVWEALKDLATKRPREDDTGNGAWTPVPLGQSKVPMGAGNLAGGAGEGRGDESVGGAGPSRQSDTAVSSQVTRAGREMKEQKDANVSLEAALAANRYSDPIRA